MKDLLDIEMLPDSMTTSNDCLEDLPIAYAYVPYQSFETPYSMEQALKFGTAFPKLNKPIDVYGKEFNRRAGVRKLW